MLTMATGTNDDFRFHLLLHSAHLLEERLRTRLAQHGVKPRQARVLDALGRMGEASQIKLAREFAVTAASMSTMTSRLVAAGLIQKRPDPEQHRSNLLTLSKRGRGLLNLIYREWREVDREVEAAIGHRQAQRLGALTFDLRNALGGRTPGKPSSGPEQTPARGSRSTC